MHRTLVIVCLAGCYTGTPAATDVDRAWVGRARVEIEDRWGPPDQRPAANTLVWTHDHVHVELPSGGGAIAGSIGPDGVHVDGAGAFAPGAIWKSQTAAIATIDPAGATIIAVEGESLRWGPPNDANLHWGAIFGLHAGMGRLDTTSTPLPSGGLYIGGMLTPQLGLVGNFALAAGTSDAGGAIGFAWGIGPMYWPINRLSLRAGPALVLTLDPGFSNASLHPGLSTAASYAFIKVGTFALDLRLDITAGTSFALGSLGVGVNVN